MDQRMNEIMKKNLYFQGERLGDSYPTKRDSWGSLLDRFGQRFPLLLVRTCKKTASKSLLEMMQNTPKMSKKFYFYTKKIYIKKSEMKS
jgi:hypothetical protein